MGDDYRAEPVDKKHAKESLWKFNFAKLSCDYETGSCTVHVTSKHWYDFRVDPKVLKLGTPPKIGGTRFITSQGTTLCATSGFKKVDAIRGMGKGIDVFLIMLCFLNNLHHCGEKEEKQEFRELIDRPLEEIIHFIKKEGGGFICTNYHTVIHRRDFKLLNKVYSNDKVVLEKIYCDYNRVIEHFTPIQNFFIKNSLESPIRITEAIISHLTALYELSKQQTEITSQDLAIYLNQESRSIRNWFVRDVNKDFLEKCVNINFGTTGYGARPNTYHLTSYGIKVSELIYHFKQYYDDLKI